MKWIILICATFLLMATYAHISKEKIDRKACLFLSTGTECIKSKYVVVYR